MFRLYVCTIILTFRAVGRYRYAADSVNSYSWELLCTIRLYFTGYGGDQGGFLNSPSQYGSPTKKEDKVSDSALACHVAL
jgi:hypothetical protein